MKRAVGATTGADVLAAHPAPDGYDTAARAIMRLSMDEALARLPEPHRAAVALRAEGYEVAEIAARTGRAKRSVERLLQDARTRLAFILGEG